MVRVMARVEFFYDYSSPWTYLAFTRIEELCRRHDAELVWRPPMQKRTTQPTARAERMFSKLSTFNFSFADRYFLPSGQVRNVPAT